MYGIEEKRGELLSFIDGLTNEKAVQKPAPDKWSIFEVLEHLYLIEKSVTSQINRTIEKTEPHTVKEKPIERTVNREYKVEAPEALQPKGQFSDLSEARASLKESREALQTLITNKDRETLEKYSFPHPAFSNLNTAQWIEFIGWHELRHLEQIKEISRSV
ncbi:DinB family protein [Halobacillus massiliensis]|uniref:DinB family protein n=1 Tax=Halobacillus massiliensis TaxID=1926286 RepID=UPI0009E4A729|nr:DinB family protein [Halobacillus massiliensis]